MRLALYQPDIPQNVGSIIRLCACMEAELLVIEPCGFPFDDKRMKRVALDYYDHAKLRRFSSWEVFNAWRTAEKDARLLLFSTKGATPYTRFGYRESDILLLGQESCGVPEQVQQAADARIQIPINPATRSLNVALAAAIALGEAKRQIAA